MLHQFTKKITSTLIREKLYKYFNYNKDFKYYSQSFDLTEIKILFLLSNNMLNKTIFFSLLLLIEKIALVNCSFVVSKKTIANFNIKKNIRVGAVYTLRNDNKEEFMHNFIDYSLKKLEDNLIFVNPSTGVFKININKSLLGLGMKSILFYNTISLSNKDYELLSPFFENISYGLYIYFFTGFRNFYLNRLILSQYGMLIY